MRGAAGRERSKYKVLKGEPGWNIIEKVSSKLCSWSRGSEGRVKDIRKGRRKANSVGKYR